MANITYTAQDFDETTDLAHFNFEASTAENCKHVLQKLQADIYSDDIAVLRTACFVAQCSANEKLSMYSVLEKLTWSSLP